VDEETRERLVKDFLRLNAHEFERLEELDRLAPDPFLRAGLEANRAVQRARGCSTDSVRD
jgi:hypothetical protein